MEPAGWTGFAAVVMGTLVILIPIAGLTLRFAIKPIADAVARFRETQQSERQLSMLEKRVTLLEQQVSHVEEDLGRVTELREFDRKLAAEPERKGAAGLPE